MRIAVGIALLSLAVSCRAGHPSEASGALQVAPGALHFEPIYAGGSKNAELTVRNPAPFSRQVRLAVSAPFFTSASSLEVPGGAETTLTVRFAPVKAGSFSGALSLDDGDTPLAVALDGVGRAVPGCPAAGVCRAVSFDPGSGKCVDTSAPDGSLCADACVTGARCLNGACAGEPVSCDDGNPCTTDSCAPGSGCVHSPMICPHATDPCHAGVCDPSSGCTTVAVPDGTECGASSCAISHVCIGGACQLRSTPEGAACGEPTPCQARGVCQNQRCVQPGPTTLQPVWSRQASGTLIFPGVADAQENLYWFEGDRLISVDRDGAFRFQVQLAAAPRPADYDSPGSQLILAAPEVLIANVGNWQPLGSATLEARSTVDGSKLWSHSYTDLIALHTADGDQGFAFMAIAAQPSTGSFIASTRSNAGGSAWNSWVAGFDVRTGALQWQTRFDYLNGLIVDAQGSAYVYENLFFNALVALDATGGQRWSLSAAEPPALTFDQTLLTGYTPHLRDPATGAAGPAFANAIFVDPLNNPLPVAKADWLVVSDSNLLCSTGLTFTDPRNGDLLGTSTVPCTVDLMLTSRDSVLVTGSNALFELPRTAGPSWTCQLPQAAAPHTALLNGRAVVPSATTVQAFDLPGVTLEPSGWPCAGGGLGRGNTPR